MGVNVSSGTYVFPFSLHKRPIQGASHNRPTLERYTTMPPS
jgi:hypothetical protein